MNYVVWHRSNDERTLASDGSQAWLAALAALPRDELTRMANAIEAELEQQRSGSSPSRFVIEDAGSQFSGAKLSGATFSATQFSGTQVSATHISEPRAPAWLLRARD